MSKKIKKTIEQDTKIQSKRIISRPEVTNMDDIAMLLDDDLQTKINSLEESRLKSINSGYDPYYWEVELSYHLRERSLRHTRRELHEKWVSEQISLFNNDESNLPYADFDNVKYMVNLHEKTRTWYANF